MRRLITMLVTASALAACADGPDPIAPPPAPPPPGSGPADADELFGAGAVWRIDLELDDAALAALAAEPRVYVEGAIVVGEHRVEHVGIRLKGSYSFAGLGGKASFKIKLDELVPEQELLGLEKLTLNAMNQDRSQLHEVLAYQVFRAAGVTASRCGFAEVSVNGEPYGLYADVESVDDELLADHYADGDGNLYEAPWTGDLALGAVDKLTQDEGDDTSRADLAALVALAQQPGDAIFFAAAQPLDTPAFLAHAASELAVGHWDGYWKPNNYYLYHERSLDQWSFIPWGLDQAFDRAMPAFSGAGVLAEKCASEPRCVAEYAAVGLAVADQFESLDLGAQVEELSDLVEPALLADERRPFPVALVRRHRRGLAAFIAATPARMRAQLDCIADGVEADADGDGFGACTADCDDGSALAHPGGLESCDGLDNDCNGDVDDLDGCPCVETAIGADQFLLCEHATRWTKAASRCAALGGTLAVPRDAGESAALYAQTQAIHATSWYLGLSDRGEEQTWVAEGEDSSVGFAAWADGEPDDWGEEDCAVLAAFGDGEWADVNCAEAYPFICAVGDRDVAGGADR